MARRANLSDDEEQDAEVQTRAGRAQREQERVNVESLSPSPVASFSSDKENRGVAGGSTARTSKAKSMGPPQATPSDRATPRPNRKRKLGERDGAPNATQAAHQQQLDDVGNRNFYDPEQSMEERRAVRKDYRDLSRELTGT